MLFHAQRKAKHWEMNSVKTKDFIPQYSLDMRFLLYSNESLTTQGKFEAKCGLLL